MERKIDASSAARMRHQAHFELLAGIPDSTSSAWLAVRAGLLALRLVDRGLYDIGPLPESDINAVLTAVYEIGVGNPIIQPLRAVVAAAHDGDLPVLAAALRDVGRTLWSRAAWTLALDVFGTGEEVARVAGEDTILLECLHGYGHSLRMLGRLVEAEAHYAILHATAERVGNRRYRLEARLGLAKTATDRGEFDAASDELREIIREARRARCRHVLSKALLDSARIAGEREDHTSALRLSYEALNLCEDARERDRILVSVARALAGVGERAAARDANLLLAATAQEREVAWFATVNLMELAHVDGRADAFESYRAQLSAEPLPVLVAIWYYECVGAGCHAFGRHAEASVAYRRMLAIAEQQGLGELAATARRALHSLLSVSSAPAPKARSNPIAVRRIAAAITQWRVAAGVAG